PFSGGVPVIGGGVDALMIGGGGDDVLFGDGGNDSLSGNGGRDNLQGADGNDVLSGGAGDDTLDGGTGTDRVVEAADTDITLTRTSLLGGTALGTDGLSSIEEASLTGGTGNNTPHLVPSPLLPFSGPVTLHRAARHDMLIGGTNDDVLNGGPGDDTLHGNAGNDTLTGSVGDDALDGSGGTDQVVESFDQDFSFVVDLLGGLHLVGATSGTDDLVAIEQAS